MQRLIKILSIILVASNVKLKFSTFLGNEIKYMRIRIAINTKMYTHLVIILLSPQEITFLNIITFGGILNP